MSLLADRWVQREGLPSTLRLPREAELGSAYKPGPAQAAPFQTSFIGTWPVGQFEDVWVLRLRKLTGEAERLKG